MSRSLTYRRAQRAMLTLCTLLLTVIFLFAVAAGDAHAAGAGHESKPLIGFDTFVLCASIGVFLVVLFILKSKAWGPLMTALDDRERKIRESLEAADRAKAESDKAAQEHERILAEARKEATAIVEEGKRDAVAIKDTIVGDARTEAESIKNHALADIKQAKATAVDDIHKRAAALSINIAEKLISKSLKPEDHEALIQDTIKSYGDLN